MPVSPSDGSPGKPFRILNLFLLLLIISVAACAETTESSYPDASFFSQKIKIVDIRTEAEWRQTGIIADSKTITFLDENGEYNEADFLRQLDRVIDKNEKFAIICRSGRRTRIAYQLLVQNGYKVIDIKGGIKHLPAGVDLVPYKP